MPREWPAVHQAICELRRPSAQGCQNSPASPSFVANFPSKYTYFLVLMFVCACSVCHGGDSLDNMAAWDQWVGVKALRLTRPEERFQLQRASWSTTPRLAGTGWESFLPIFQVQMVTFFKSSSVCVTFLWASDPACQAIHMFGFYTLWNTPNCHFFTVPNTIAISLVILNLFSSLHHFDFSVKMHRAQFGFKCHN